MRLLTEKTIMRDLGIPINSGDRIVLFGGDMAALVV
jgi:hypothetical protein